MSARLRDSFTKNQYHPLQLAFCIVSSTLWFIYNNSAIMLGCSVKQIIWFMGGKLRYRVCHDEGNWLCYHATSIIPYLTSLVWSFSFLWRGVVKEHSALAQMLLNCIGCLMKVGHIQIASSLSCHRILNVLRWILKHNA